MTSGGVSPCCSRIGSRYLDSARRILPPRPAASVGHDLDGSSFAQRRSKVSRKSTRRRGSLVTIRFSSLSLAAPGSSCSFRSATLPRRGSRTCGACGTGSGPPASGCPTVESVHVRARILRLCVIGDDPNGYLPTMRIEDGVGDAVVGDREHADVGGPARVRQESRDRSETILTRAEERLCHGRRVGGLADLAQSPVDVLQPDEDGEIVRMTECRGRPRRRCDGSTRGRSTNPGRRRIRSKPGGALPGESPIFERAGEPGDDLSGFHGRDPDQPCQATCRAIR